MSNRISTKKAILLNAVAKYSVVVIQLVYTAILSRILSPDEFGIIAVINVFIVFFQLVADMGFGSAIIQNKNMSKDDINSIYSIMIYIGLLLCIIFIAFSYPISIFYNNSIYISLGFILSFSLMFNAFNAIPNAVILKNKKFFIIAIRTIVVYLLSAVFTLLFAINGFGVYALALYSVITAFLLYAWNLFSTGLKFQFMPNFNVLKEILSYSLYQFGSQAVNYFSRNLDNLFIGKFFSISELGFYNKSYTLMMYPISYIPGVITPVLHPILSEYQNEKKVIYSKYLLLIKFLGYIGCFISIYCFFLSKELILLAFGNQWINSITSFKLLSLSLMFQILTNTIAPIYQSVGDTKLMFKSTLISTFIIVSTIIGGITLGSIEYVALSLSVGYILNFFITFYIMINKCFKLKFRRLLYAFRYVFLFFIILILSTYLYPFNFSDLFISLVLKTIYLTFIYIFLLIITKQYKIILFRRKK